MAEIDCESNNAYDFSKEKGTIHEVSEFLGTQITFIEKGCDFHHNNLSPESNKYDLYYEKRGLALIMDTGNAQDVTSCQDISNLYKSLRRLHFRVKVFKNCKVQQMDKIINIIANSNQFDADCFLSIALTHHGEGDKIVSINDLATPLKYCPSLDGKPKLFFVLSCKDGEGECQQTYDYLKSENLPYPKDADHLWMLATPSCNTVHENKSWFTQELCKLFKDYTFGENFIIGLIRMNSFALTKFKESRIFFSSTLTKDIRFKRKFEQSSNNMEQYNVQP